MHSKRNKARIVAAPAQHQSLGRILWQQHGRRAVIAANRRNATPALETFLARVELGHTPDIPHEELPRVDDGSHLPSKFEPVAVGLGPSCERGGQIRDNETRNLRANSELVRDGGLLSYGIPCTHRSAM